MNSIAEVLPSRRGGILEIKLARPEAGNRLNRAMMRRISELIGGLDARSTSVVIIAHEGPAFCVGGELGDFRQQDADDVKAFVLNLTWMLERIKTAPVPVLAAVEGDAGGAGFSLLEACDMAAASQAARFSTREILGNLPPVVSFSGAFRVMPEKRLMEMALLGVDIAAEEALHLGLLTAVTAPGGAMQRCDEWADFIGSRNPNAIRTIKEMRSRMDGRRYTTQLESAGDLLVQALLNKNARETLDAGEQGRPPAYEGYMR